MKKLTERNKKRYFEVLPLILRFNILQSNFSSQFHIMYLFFAMQISFKSIVYIVYKSCRYINFILCNYIDINCIILRKVVYFHKLLNYILSFINYRLLHSRFKFTNRSLRYSSNINVSHYQNYARN